MALAKLSSTLISVKFWILVAASLFFHEKTLSETGWITIVLAFGGFRTLNEIAGMVKEVKTNGHEKTGNGGKNQDFGDS
jgi:hypothetical protein